MRLSTFIQRTRALGDAKVPTHIVDALGDRIAKGTDLGSVLKHRNTTLTPRVLLGIWRAARVHQRHMAYLGDVARKRREAKETAIAPAVLKQTLSAHEVAVLARAEQLAPPGSVAEHRRRDAIKEALALWKACLAIAHKEGVLSISLVTEDEALAAQFGELVQDTTLAALKPAQWMDVRHGMDAGALDLSLEVPVKRLVDQMKARGTELAALARGEKDEELLQKLVLIDLDEWAVALKDEASRSAAYRTASSEYLRLLAAPAATQPLAAGVTLDGDQLAVAVVGHGGEWHGGGAAPVGESPMATVEGLIGNHPVELVVLPAEGEGPVFDALTEGFGSHFQLVRVPSAALDAAVALEGEAPEGGPAASRAASLARRAMQPLTAWGQLDPVELNLAQYQQDLDLDELRAWMLDMKIMAEAGVKLEDLARPAAKPRAPRGPAKPLNPMVKSVDDLRPGLVVNGVVTNITQFGAFVNIGLSHEGLVHVSELADHFVNDPNEVVKVNQHVEARVLGVDRARRRISLSLRPDREAPTAPRADDGGERGEDGAKRRVRLDDIPGRGRGRRGGGGGGFDRRPPGPGGNATGASRAQALAELERLFKK